MSDKDQRAQRWTNSSALALAGDSDPLEILTAKVRELIFNAFEAGWSGPPYDPFALAALLGIEVAPSKDVVDAQILSGRGRSLRIVFNPDRPAARINYSVAHELGHSLFPDCADLVRNRTRHTGATRDEWQLEMLCNIAAAEILMPVGTLRAEDLKPEVDRLLELRQRYAVSSEAVLLRMLRLTPANCLGFVARREPDSSTGHYKIDYAVGSPSWQLPVKAGLTLSQKSVISQCTAIGFTAKATEKWLGSQQDYKVEAVGIPPYPGRTYPRVVGIVRAVEQVETVQKAITYLKGDATNPRGTGLRYSPILLVIVDWFGEQVLVVRLERNGQKFKMSLRSGQWDITVIFIWATFTFREWTIPCLSLTWWPSTEWVHPRHLVFATVQLKTVCESSLTSR